MKVLFVGGHADGRRESMPERLPTYWRYPVRFNDGNMETEEYSLCMIDEETPVYLADGYAPAGLLKMLVEGYRCPNT